MIAAATSRDVLEPVVARAVPSPELAALYVRALHDDGLTLGQLARLLGTRYRKTVARYVAGERVPTSRVAREALATRARIATRGLTGREAARALTMARAKAVARRGRLKGARGILAAACEQTGANENDTTRGRRTAACVEARRLVALAIVRVLRRPQGEAAKVLGVTPSTVSRLLRERVD